MLGLSYGEVFLILGATAALIGTLYIPHTPRSPVPLVQNVIQPSFINGVTVSYNGPKDLPRIARVAGRLAGRSIGYIRLARGQFDNVMEHSKVHQMHKDMTDQKAQFDVILHEMRNIISLNPSLFTKTQMGNIGTTSMTTENPEPGKTDKQELSMPTTSKDQNSVTSGSSDMYSQATTYAKLAESTSLKSKSSSNQDLYELTDESGITVLPLSAESTGMLPSRRGDAKGSDIMLEAVVEADVARNAKDFFRTSLKSNEA